MKTTKENTGVLKWVFLFSLSILLFAGCKKEDTSWGNMTVKMTDSPGNLGEVNVEITGMDVNYSDQKSGNSGWLTLAVKSGVYDLLQLQNNITVVLADNVKLPIGKVNQLRLMLGTHNYVVTGDSSGRQVFPLVIPSSAQTGIKINIDSQIESTKNLVITLDFDAAASVNNEGNGTFIMNPVIRVKSVVSQ